MKRADIDLLVCDFDGVLTDNRVLVSENGTEFVWCSRADGLGVNLLKASGLQIVIVSSEHNKVVEARARKLGLKVFKGVDDKGQLLIKLSEQLDLQLSRTAFIGNDINDLSAMELVGWPLCPSDAHPKIKAISALIFSSGGGEGVLRELSDLILQV